MSSRSPKMFQLLCLAAVLVGLVTTTTDSDWAVFKAKHGKLYSQEENRFRRLIYEDNLKKIQAHNELFAKGESSFYLGVNEYADQTTSEFVKTMNHFRPSGAKRSPNRIFKHLNSSLPSEVNWVKEGYVTGVKNQGQCGSCWSFSATGAVEGAHFKATGKLVSLSEKNLIDCSGRYGNQGCKGGQMDRAFKYIIDNKGIDKEASYPYQPREGHCKFNRDNVGATISGYVDVRAGSEMDLQEAAAKVGPVSVAIDASHSSFQFYHGGVYDEHRCSSHKLDHGVLLVGYGTEHGKDYWLVKNSWGRGWGEGGCIKMSRNKNNQCGIATQASYPLV